MSALGWEARVLNQTAFRSSSGLSTDCGITLNAPRMLAGAPKRRGVPTKPSLPMLVASTDGRPFIKVMIDTSPLSGK